MKRDFSTFILYALGFLLLWEWLRPIEEITDTSHIGTFIVFMLICFVLSYLRMHWPWQWLIKIVFILAAINRLHYHEGFFHGNWVIEMAADLINNLTLLFSNSWNQLSNEFRTLVFFILIWIMVYLLHYWLLRRQRIFLFVFLTLVYITVLDTFSPYNANIAIIRTVVIGFAIMGLLTFHRITQTGQVAKSSVVMRKWMIPLAIMISISVLLGLAAPKANPIWPDPVPYLTAAQNKGGDDGKGPNRIGYGTNDEHLGGPFIGDDTPVFTYQASGRNYWKVETKDVYTGKGWISSGAAITSYKEGDPVPIPAIPDKVEYTEAYGQVHFYHNSGSFILYPAGIQTILNVQPQASDLNLFQVDTNKEKITPRDSDISGYTIKYKIPKYNAAELRKTTKYNAADMDSDFYQNYTQLKKELPPRIKKLTEKITAGKANWFDKAKAVETYLNSAEFTYDQTKVAIPGKNDDYVDQFLFETKRGYCDNFSTAMAVMLRTIGIPTRWVKGFNGGDFMKYAGTETSMQQYRVTNNNAHSWVEVYIPSQGWIPFEPTKGFYNGISIDYSTEQSSTTPASTAPAPVKKPQQEQVDDTKQVKQESSSMDYKALWTKTVLFFKSYWKNICLILILAAGVTGILYRIRGKWLPYVWMVRFHFKKKDDTIAPAFTVLLGQLSRYGLKRKENQTLRSYAQYVDAFFSTQEMTRFTSVYEQYLYHQKLPEGSWREVSELWENLIKKTIA